MKPIRSSIGAAVLGLALVGASGNGCESASEQLLEARAEKSIVNGTPTGDDIWTGVLAIYSLVKRTIGCSAVLIDPEVMLSAAHCVNPDMSVAEMRGGVGADLFIAQCTVGVDHPGWPGQPGSSSVDLAVTQLASPITSVERYKVRNAPDAEQGDKGKIVGYGLPGTNEPADFIRRVGDTTLLNFDQNLIEIGDPAGACPIDSGSPFFTDQNGGWVVNGIASAILDGICYGTHGSFYTNTFLHRDWIDAHVKNFTGHGLDETTDTDSDSDSDSDGDFDSDGDSDADDDADDDDDNDDNDDHNDDNDNDDNDDDDDTYRNGNGCNCRMQRKGVRPVLLTFVM